MGHCFSHLTKADRYKIEALLNNGHSAKEIAAEIHVHISTMNNGSITIRVKYWAGKLLQCASENALTRYKNKFSIFFAFTIDISVCGL